MSHKATNWLADIPPKELTNAEFRILFVLCDCHNPSAGCFPKQSYIMSKTGRGNSSVNDALAGLEGKGFIRREQRTNPKTGKREATHYILGFEMDGPQEPTPNSGDGGKGPKPEQSGAPTPNSGDGSISGFSADPSPVFGQNHLRKTGVVYKEEPSRISSMELNRALRMTVFSGPLLGCGARITQSPNAISTVTTTAPKRCPWVSGSA